MIKLSSVMIVYVCDGSFMYCMPDFFFHQKVQSGWPKFTKCRSPQMETFTCYWSHKEFSNETDPVKLQYRTSPSDLSWRDCPDDTSGGNNSCFFSTEHVSIWSDYFVRLVRRNLTFDTYNFSFTEIVEPDPPVALSWSLQDLSDNNSLLDIHVTWQPPPSSTMLFLEYEVQIKEATKKQWKSFDVVSATYLPVYGLKVGKEYLIRVRCRLRGNEKFGEFSEDLVIPELASVLKSKVPTTSTPRSSPTVNNRRPLQRGMKKTYPPGWPSLTYCRSPQQETFTCYWTYGVFQNISLKLQYMKPGMNWTDCPDNVSAGENSCYFSREHTSIWVGYIIRLVSENTTYYEDSFTVDEIVRPDPPIALNWTVLNVSATRLRMDIELTWEPPASADVKSGWITLEYEIQIKVVNETQWKTYDVVTTTYSPVYGLNIGKEYLIRVRCRQKGNENYGEFSDEILVPTIVSVEPEFPWPLFLIIGIFALLLILSFILFCKKKRLKMLILPPVPVPKIKGIDPALLQKGKLDEVSSILASHDSYKQQLCCDDPWVEFIELDLDDQEEKNEGTDTDRLLAEEFHKTHSCLGVKDDDSGRASCCEPDIPETDFGNSDETSDTGQSQNTKDNQADLLCLSEKSHSGDVPTNPQMPNTENMSTKPVDCRSCSLLGNEMSVAAIAQVGSIGSKPSMDFYALVTDITPAGRLLLSPGQRTKMENEECNEPAMQHPPNLNMDNSYVSDTAMTAFCAVNFPAEASQSVQQSPNLDSYFTPESFTAAAMRFHATENASSYETPVADYTSVHILNSPQNLVLNTTAPPGKEFLQPCGYMSTDQANKMMP